jgi:hypothetical protein
MMLPIRYNVPRIGYWVSSMAILALFWMGKGLRESNHRSQLRDGGERLGIDKVEGQVRLLTRE